MILVRGPRRVCFGHALAPFFTGSPQPHCDSQQKGQPELGANSSTAGDKTYRVLFSGVATSRHLKTSSAACSRTQPAFAIPHNKGGSAAWMPNHVRLSFCCAIPHGWMFPKCGCLAFGCVASPKHGLIKWLHATLNTSKHEQL